MDKYYQEAYARRRNERLKAGVRVVGTGVGYASKAVGKSAVYTGKAVKGTYDLIGGLKGVTGAVAGTLIGGPIGGLAGILIANNTKPIGNAIVSTTKGTKKAVNGTVETIARSAEYQQIDPSASYSWNSLRNYMTSNAASDAAQQSIGISKKRKVINSVRRSFGYAARAVSNVVSLPYRTAKNAGEHRKLEAAAEELSKREGAKVTPQQVFQLIQSEKQKKVLTKTLGEIQKELLRTQRDFMSNPTAVTPEQRVQYNDLVDAQYQVADELGITDPSKLYHSIRTN